MEDMEILKQKVDALIVFNSRLQDGIMAVYNRNLELETELKKITKLLKKQKKNNKKLKENVYTNLPIVEDFLRERLKDGNPVEVCSIVEEAESNNIFGIWDYLKTKQLPFVEYRKGNEFGAKWIIKLI